MANNNVKEAHMMDRFRRLLAIAALLGCLGIWPAWTAPAQNGGAPFCVHKTSTQSYFNKDGKATTVIHQDFWQKDPDKHYVENENYIRLSNGHTSWSYHKQKHTFRNERPAMTPKEYFTADYRISCARTYYNRVEVKETPGDPRGTRLPVVDIYYQTRDAKPCKVHEHITMVDSRTRLMKELHIETLSSDGTYICRRLEESNDYSPITDESVFYRTLPRDAVLERTSGK
jgi:hypothetical protein